MMTFLVKCPYCGLERKFDDIHEVERWVAFHFLEVHRFIPEQGKLVAMVEQVENGG